MTLTPTRTILDEARAAGHGAGAFNVVHLETAEALAGAAEASGLPVILQLSENCIRFHGALDYGTQINGARFDLQLAGDDAGNVQQVVDQL